MSFFASDPSGLYPMAAIALATGAYCFFAVAAVILRSIRATRQAGRALARLLALTGPYLPAAILLLALTKDGLLGSGGPAFCMAWSSMMCLAMRSAAASDASAAANPSGATPERTHKPEEF